MRSTLLRIAMLPALVVLGVSLAFAHLPSASAHGLQASAGAIASMSSVTAEPFSVAVEPVITGQSSGNADTCAGDSWCIYCMNYPASSVCMAYPPVAQAGSTVASQPQMQPAITSGASAAPMALAGNADRCLGDSWCAYCANYPSSSVCAGYPPVPISNTTMPVGHP